MPLVVSVSLRSCSMEPVRSHSHRQSDAALPLFLHGVGRVVLLGYAEGGEWVLARGWRSRDRFSDIRRWRFHDVEAFTKQVYRLAREEDATPAAADAAAAAASLWVSASGIY